MIVSPTDTSRSYTQRVMQQASRVGTEVSTGKKSRFPNSSDIMIGEISRTTRLMYSSSNPGLDNITTLLHTTNGYLQEMSCVLQSLTSLYNQASTQTLSQSALSTLDSLFQTELIRLDQIATNSSVGSIIPLNGSISTININTPTGDVIPLTLPNMTNAASPITMQTTSQSTISAFAATVGKAADVLSSIQAFCGQNSFLYIVANQINIALTAGVDAAPGIADEDAGIAARIANMLAAGIAAGIDQNPDFLEYITCLATLQEVNWDDLLSPADALAARTLMFNRAFTEDQPTNTLQTCIELAGAAPDAALYAAISTAITRAYIPSQYIVQTSNMPNISSPVYFAAAAQTLQSTRMYLAAAQSSINQNVLVVDGLRARYAAAEDLYGESADKFLNIDIVKASTELQELTTSLPSVIDATTGFQSKVSKTIADAVAYILRS